MEPVGAGQAIALDPHAGAEEATRSVKTMSDGHSDCN